MNIDITNRLYKKGPRVYFGTTELTVHDQRGRMFIKHRGRQTNIKDVPVLPALPEDPVFDYVFGGGSVSHPCPEMDYWIHRHRMGRKVSVQQYKTNKRLVTNQTTIEGFVKYVNGLKPKRRVKDIELKPSQLPKLFPDDQTND